MYAELGKPDGASGLYGGQGRSRDLLMLQRVKDGGESECRSVMGRIGDGTCPDAKACRLPLGNPSQDGLVISTQRGDNALPFGAE